MPSAARPTVRLLPSRHKRVMEGHPWVYSNEAAMDAAAKAIPPGTVVKLAAADGRILGAAFFNPHSLICARMLSGDGNAEIGTAFLAARLKAALALRHALYDRPYYRLVHSEGDGLPGLIVDRFGDVAVCQLNAAGMDRLSADLLAALAEVLAPKAVVFRNDTPARALEGLERNVTVALGEVSAPVVVEEGGARFFIDPMAGQKTGWFFDQRDNRAFMASLAHGRSVADFYCYTGGFAIRCALAGASMVHAFDSSEPALDLARRSAEANGVATVCRFAKAEAYGEMERLGGAGGRFDIVICDPPAFVKSRKDLNAGAKGYRKMARLAAALVSPSGFLFAASCSHNMPAERFGEEIAKGIAQAGRTGRVIRQAGASPDHPIHPLLPESAYLKAAVLQLD